VRPYLSDDEIAEITRPLTQGAARIKFFRRIGVRVEEQPNGQPLVWRSEFEAARHQAANEPSGQDWSALESRVRYGRGKAAQGR
jgi:hypothetical protein